MKVNTEFSSEGKAWLKGNPATVPRKRDEFLAHHRKENKKLTRVIVALTRMNKF